MASLCSHHVYMPNLQKLLVYTDEKRFYFNGLNYSSSVWSHKDSTKNNTIFKFPKGFEKNSILIWGAVSHKGALKLTLCSKTIDSDEYILILKDFIPTAKIIYPNNEYFLVQDNASCHVSKKTRKFLSESAIDILDWPPSSPDLNIIENVWKMLEDAVYKENRVFSSKTDLWKAVNCAWNELDREVIRNMTEGFNGRLDKVLECDGEIIN